jgi:glutathione synthase/RimK-type ligase-like ATP-grasp enzyme
MKSFDLAIAHTWIYDMELTRQVEKMFQENELTTFLIDTNNIDQVTASLKTGKLFFRAILDRASDENIRFEQMAKIVPALGTYVINEYDKIDRAIDKHVMHVILEKKKFPLPYTVIVPPYKKQSDYILPDKEKRKLDTPFIIKPSYYSGGSEGVHQDAAEQKHIDAARMENTDDHYLIQKKIYPKYHYGKRVWIRAYWFFDEVFVVWWDDLTHVYSEMTKEEFEELNVQRLVYFTQKIARITGLDYFSTEGTIDEHDELYLIDYVNDQCDMRKKSQHHDGVPDIIVEIFVKKMLAKVKTL